MAANKKAPGRIGGRKLARIDAELANAIDVVRKSEEA